MHDSTELEVVNVDEETSGAAAVREEQTGLSAVLDAYCDGSSCYSTSRQTTTETDASSDAGPTAWTDIEKTLGSDFTLLQHFKLAT